MPIELPQKLSKRELKKARKRSKRAASAAIPPGQELALTLPSTLRMLVAASIDLIMLAALFVVIAVGEAYLLEDPAGPRAATALDAVAQWVDVHAAPVRHAALLTLIAGLFYAVNSARDSGRTLGRRLTGTVLVRRSGKEIGWALAIFRAVISVISALACGAGFFYAIVNPQRRTLHDVLAGTYVVHRKLRAAR